MEDECDNVHDIVRAARRWDDTARRNNFVAIDDKRDTVPNICQNCA